MQRLATGSVLHVPMPFVALAIASVVMWVVLHRSVYGRHLFATGRNETAARDIVDLYPAPPDRSLVRRRDSGQRRPALPANF
jgi:Branched-chain amino acid transport system / permease component